MNWGEIDAALPSIVEADAGFSSAHRGLVSLESGQQVFVKIGVDGATCKGVQKEIAVYRFLAKHNYPHTPRLLATNDNESAFALEPLLPVHWSWAENWTKARLDITLEAMDALAAIVPEKDDKAFFEEHAVDETKDGWLSLSESSEKQDLLRIKLADAGYVALAAELDFGMMSERVEGIVFANNALVHNDLRADNAAWNESRNSVKLVDWDWTMLGDRRFDLAATLTHVQKAGFDLFPGYAERLDSDALHWMAGFWFHSALKPIWPGGPEHLSDRRLITGITALALSQHVEALE